MTTGATPSVLFVCVKNGGKSQMAAALMRHHADHTGLDVEVHSAGTQPGSALNQLSAEAVAEVGADMSTEVPKPIDAALLRRVDRVIVLGAEALLEPVENMRATPESWHIVEPSRHGIDGIERMRHIREDIDQRVKNLLGEMSALPR